MLERVEGRGARPGTWFCNNCSHDWVPGPSHPRRFASLDDLVARTGLRRDEVVTLADIGALNCLRLRPARGALAGRARGASLRRTLLGALHG